MKRIILFIFTLGSLLAFGVNPADLRIYINPGHGSWGSKDRPLTVIRQQGDEIMVVSPKADGSTTRPDTTAFYETNTNLRKCLAMVDKLESYGFRIDRTLNQTGSNKYRIGAALDLHNNICMSHVMGGPWPTNDASSTVCNRSLSEIAQEVQANNFDMFISVHSNALDDGGLSNYLLFLYRGTDTSPSCKGSKEMATTAWPYLHSVEHNRWTNFNSTKNIRGDITFYNDSWTNSATGATGYLGALMHNVPGYLAEGYFHSYHPARHRAMNFDVDRWNGAYIYK